MALLPSLDFLSGAEGQWVMRRCQKLIKIPRKLLEHIDMKALCIQCIKNSFMHDVPRLFLMKM